MFIDYLTLIMINMIAGVALLAQFLWKGLDSETDQRSYAPAFGGVGLLAVILGLAMSLTWPLPGNHNISYGGATTLFGIVFLAAAYALSQGWSLIPVGTLAFFAGVYALLVGVNILFAGTAQEPPVAGVGFLISGLGGIFAAPYLMFFREKKTLHRLAIFALLLIAVVWMIMFVASFWIHLNQFADWMPK
jgi:putative membrane protein